MRKLYLQIYLTVVIAIVVVTFGAGFLWRHVMNHGPPYGGAQAVGELVGASLPPPDAPAEAQRQALEALRGRVPSDLALYSAIGVPIAATGQPLPPPDLTRRESGWVGGPGRRPAWAIPLSDGRWLVARLGPQFRPPPVGLVAFLALVAAAVAIGALPAVRRLTRRLERLQQGVEALGAGNLAARVPVEGRDEVAKLATSFNASAERIEALVGAHRTLLANASHELRSPLTRIQMAVDLIKRDAKPELAMELERNVAELDQLVGEILLASRLDAVKDDVARESVDLLALAAEETARFDAQLDGEPVTVLGEPRLLRRLVRNLIENARRHGGESPIDVSVHPGAAGRVALAVSDRGPGVAASERERIFEPFYRPAGASERAGSVGLGLALVRTIARRHGGEARYEPRAGGGASFVVELPSV